MKHFLIIAALLFAATCSAFHVASKQSSTSMRLSARSKSVPFLDQPKALNGKLPGDVGFDPLGLSNIWEGRDWSENVVPDIWPEPIQRTPITTVQWMREAELKHGRLAMLAVLGWVAVDFGLRLPGDGFSEIPNSLAAHKEAVENGSMGVLLNVCAVLELIGGAAIFDQARGSGRAPGDFAFDPLGFGRDQKSRERYATSEVKNGRLAMLAFAGIVTQAALFPDTTFPFF